MNTLKKIEKVVVGVPEINEHLADGWRVVKIIPHSERRENWFGTNRGADYMEFWLVAHLMKYEDEAVES